MLNLPVAAIACFACLRLVTESRDENTTRKIDYAGIATLTIALISLLLALDQVTLWGWTDPRILGLFGLCVVLLVAFVVRERRAGDAALVPRDVMANVQFRAVCLVTLLISATFFAALLFLPAVPAEDPRLLRRWRPASGCCPSWACSPPPRSWPAGSTSGWGRR